MNGRLVLASADADAAAGVMPLTDRGARSLFVELGPVAPDISRDSESAAAKKALVE